MKVDFHAHILPGIDHGCDSREMAFKQISMAKDEGIERIVATSHFYAHIDRVSDFIEKRNAAYASLEKAGDIVIPAAEVLVCPHMEAMPELEKLCISGTNTILLEMPFQNRWEEELIETVFAIRDKRNLQVILAHVDRYPYKSVSRLTKEGILAQLNADAVCSMKKRRLCRKYIEEGCVAALGSDLHGSKKNGYKKFSKAVKILGTDVKEIFDRSYQIIYE